MKRFVMPLFALSLIAQTGTADTKQPARQPNILLVFAFANPALSAGKDESNTVEYGLDGVVKNGTVDTRVGPLAFENGYPSRHTVEELFDVMGFQRATQERAYTSPIWYTPGD